MISLRPILVMYVVDLRDLDIVYTNCCNHHLVLMNIFLQLDHRNKYSFLIESIRS